MVVASEPNWLIVVGLVYTVYAFGLLALSALSHGVQFDPASRLASETKQRVCRAFAGIAGLIGASLQALGQVVHLSEGLAVVVMLLGVIVLLLSYLTFSGRMAKLSERPGAAHGSNVLSMHASTPGAFGQAAE